MNGLIIRLAPLPSLCRGKQYLTMAPLPFPHVWRPRPASPEQQRKIGSPSPRETTAQHKGDYDL